MQITKGAPVLVLDGHLKQALCIVRSLGQKKLSVIVGAERPTAMARHSRYQTESFVYPSPLVDQQGFVDVVLTRLKVFETPPVVYCSSDATLLTLYQHWDDFKDLINLPLPRQESIDIAFDKAATYSEAKILGIPVIPTYLREQAAEFEKIKQELSFPMVVKPRRSAAWGGVTGFSGTASFVQSLTELRETFSDLKQKTGEAPLVQPLVEGEEYGVYVVAHKGTILATSVHHRIRSMSPTGGASVVKETSAIEGVAVAMVEMTETLVQALAWEGPLMVEFKVDSDTKVPRLMELNGRWAGSLPLAVIAGVDLPYIYYRLVTHGDVPEAVVTAASEVVSKHWLGDVRHVLRVWLARDPMRARLYPSRKKALRDFFGYPRGAKNDIWSWRDPVPGVMEFVDVVYKLWK